tara:strand:- start:2573 stop:3580 length:1008 start_codon:yes stop_codon:yes gene_type:complete
MARKFRILGSGEWGLAIAYHLSKNGCSVEIYGRTKSKVDTLKQSKKCESLGIKFNDNVSFDYLSNILNKSFSTDTYNIIATSSSGFSDLIEQNKKYLSKYSSFIWLTKGLDQKSNKFFDQLLTDTFGGSIDCCLISGPSFAKDLVSGEKICVSVASNSNKYLDTVEKCFGTNMFEMQKTNDLIGVQISGIMKNIAAILSGILTSDNYSNSDILRMIEVTKKEIFEITKHIYFIRGLPVDDTVIRKTLTSPSCDGDLRLSCLSDVSRNRRFGLQLKQSDSHQLIDDLGTVEGYLMAPALFDMIISSGGIVGPVLESTHKIVFCDAKLEDTQIINHL